MSRSFRIVATMLLVGGIGSAAVADSIVVNYSLGGGNTFNLGDHVQNPITATGNSSFSGFATLTFNATAGGAFASGAVHIANWTLNVSGSALILSSGYPVGGQPVRARYIVNATQSGVLGSGGISFSTLAVSLGGRTLFGQPTTQNGALAPLGPTAFAGGTPANFVFALTGAPLLTAAIGTQTGSLSFTELSRTFMPMGDPIPEPSGTALFAVGLGMIGWHLRRR